MTLKSREKVLLFFVIIALAIWAFDRFYYTPQGREILKLREQIKGADRNLSEFAAFTLGAAALEAEISRLEEGRRKLIRRTLHGQEFKTFLRQVAEYSDRLQIKVISVRVQEEKVPLPGEKKGLPAFQSRRITVQMVLHSSYASLGTYLKGIQELPFLVAVDNLQMKRDEANQPLFKVTMGLTMVLISS
jgi:Tfp pilus assembly protein PilN